MTEHDILLAVQRQIAGLVAEKAALQTQIDGLVAERDALRAQVAYLVQVLRRADVKIEDLDVSE